MQQLDSHFVACLLYLTVRRCPPNIVFMRALVKSVIDFATKNPLTHSGEGDFQFWSNLTA